MKKYVNFKLKAFEINFNWSKENWIWTAKKGFMKKNSELHNGRTDQISM